MEATCTTQHKILTGIFDIGDRVEITLKYATERKLLVIGHRKEYEEHRGKSIEVRDETLDVWQGVGDYLGYSIQSKNGSSYCDKCIMGFIGYKSLGDIFTRN